MYQNIKQITQTSLKIKVSCAFSHGLPLVFLSGSPIRRPIWRPPLSTVAEIIRLHLDWLTFHLRKGAQNANLFLSQNLAMTKTPLTFRKIPHPTLLTVGTAHVVRLPSQKVKSMTSVASQNWGRGWSICPWNTKNLVQSKDIWRNLIESAAICDKN